LVADLTSSPDQVFSIDAATGELICDLSPPVSPSDILVAIASLASIPKSAELHKLDPPAVGSFFSINFSILGRDAEFQYRVDNYGDIVPEGMYFEDLGPAVDSASKVPPEPVIPPSAGPSTPPKSERKARLSKMFTWESFGPQTWDAIRNRFASHENPPVVGEFTWTSRGRYAWVYRSPSLRQVFEIIATADSTLAARQIDFDWECEVSRF